MLALTCQCSRAEQFTGVVADVLELRVCSQRSKREAVVRSPIEIAKQLVHVSANGHG